MRHSSDVPPAYPCASTCLDWPGRNWELKATLRTMRRLTRLRDRSGRGGGFRVDLAMALPESVGANILAAIHVTVSEMRTVRCRAIHADEPRGIGLN